MQTQNNGSVASSTIWEEVTDNNSVHTSSSSNNNSIATVASASSGLSFTPSLFKPLIDVNFVPPKPSTFNQADAK